MYSQYDNIVNRLHLGRLWDFPGGVHPPQLKSMSNGQNINTIDLPEKLYITLKQHIGVEGSVIVEVGDKVLKGQALTRSTNPFSVPVHASTSGTVTRIAPHVSAHPSGIPELTIEISPDGQDNWIELTAISDYQQQPKSKLIEAICQAGISGMGGAGFPTHIKASPKKNVEFLIINGVECEPYITSDDRLMREHAWQIRQGIDVLTHLLDPKIVVIAIEDNKPQAIQAMQVACQENARYLVTSIPTKYPAGGEKQLIQVLTNREVPGTGLPIDVGVIMQNVGTCFAIADAIFSGKPLIQRVVTLTGKAFQQPQNVWAPIGTPIAHLLKHGDYQQKRQKQQKIIMGGPMMGFELIDDATPVVKITNCILAPSAEEILDPGPEQSCIRCSACADACPASLLPQQLFWYSKAKELDKAQEYNLFDCIECGACAYVCPSEIPLVHYYRVAKSEIRTQQHEKDQSDKARQRFEARKERLAKEQQEREARHAKAAAARKQAMAEKGNDAQDKIAAALARAKAKKENQQSVHSPAPAQIDQQDKVAAAIARAKAKKSANEHAKSPSASQASVIDQNNSDESVKKDKVAAAIARAKAKREAAKLAQRPVAESDPAPESNTQQAQESTLQGDKKQKVAAAIAKAKAKREAAKLAQQPVAESDPAPESDTQQAQESTSQDDKKQKVAAAIAKAKAKREAAKLAQQPVAESDPAPESDTQQAQGDKKPKATAVQQTNDDVAKGQELPHEGPPDNSAQQQKKQKIAIAVAKAKAKREAAKKAQKQDGN